MKRRSWNSTLPAPTQPIARFRLPRVNATRKARSPSEFARIYGSKKRVAWIKTRPCIVPFCAGDRIEGHHVIGDGTSRKADACWIVPLCWSHHREVHNQGSVSFGRKYGLNLAVSAVKVERAWLAFSGGEA